MKKHAPFILLTCLLMTTAGCYRKPAKAIVLIPQGDNEPPAIYAEEGGILEFRMDSGTPANSTFEVQFPEQICKKNDRLVGTNTQPVRCHVIAPPREKAYSITVQETIASTKTTGRHRLPPRGVQAYIRPCNNCGLGKK